MAWGWYPDVSVSCVKSIKLMIYVNFELLLAMVPLSLRMRTILISEHAVDSSSTLYPMIVTSNVLNNYYYHY